jgi:tRNA(fMet)-specific endonuclease VapC
VVVAAELRYGAAKKGSPRLSRQLEAILEVLNILPLEAPADRFYGTLRVDLERRGELIGPNNLLIAAHALALEGVLVTDNEREFARVPDLQMQNWLRQG